MLVVVRGTSERGLSGEMRNGWSKALKEKVTREVGLVPKLVFQLVLHPGLEHLDRQAISEGDVIEIPYFWDLVVPSPVVEGVVPRGKGTGSVDEGTAMDDSDVGLDLSIEPAAQLPFRDIEGPPGGFRPIVIGTWGMTLVMLGGEVECRLPRSFNLRHRFPLAPRETPRLQPFESSKALEGAPGVGREV